MQKNKSDFPESVSLEGIYVYDDIDNFLTAYHLLKPDSDTIAVLKKNYFDKATIGLTEFVQKFDLTPEKLTKSIQKHPMYYQSLVNIKERLVNQEANNNAMYSKLQDLYSIDSLPKIYYMIGGIRAGGNGGDGYYTLVGAEIFAKKDNTDMSEFSKGARLFDINTIPNIVGHESIHVIQESIHGTEKYISMYMNPEEGTILAFSIREGFADFAAHLISGKLINQKTYAYGNAHEEELWNLYKTQMHSTDLGDWFFINPKDHPEWPKDLGYWMGYKIAEAYYSNADDKKKAFASMMNETDPVKFLKDSKYEEKFK
ncbi:DUF2268 domain-containing putative Zn-dependent protease [Leptobacterium sp. I13]|uniref:gliding motility protein GldB-related protein n=1 Tax=Leptobacterium meishanense TaxID=3128904 RepID=UPI0030EB5DE5